MLSSQDFRRLYWLSGTTCAGKTTISTQLGEQLNWNVYHCDDWEKGHRDRADKLRHPKWFSYSRLTGDALWLQPNEQHVKDCEDACDEQLELILEDLSEQLKADSRTLLYDGYISPINIKALNIQSSRVFYLVSSDEFRNEFYVKRPWIHDVLAKTSNPELAWKNWMTRDSVSAKLLTEQLKQLNLRWLLIDGTSPKAEVLQLVQQHFLA